MARPPKLKELSENEKAGGPPALGQWKAISIDFLHVGGLGTFRSLDNLKFDRVSFLQSSIAVSHDCGIMNENVRAVLAPYEAITFRIIEPFYRSTHLVILPGMEPENLPAHDNRVGTC
jgi:hypothetical protein